MSAHPPEPPLRPLGVRRRLPAWGKVALVLAGIALALAACVPNTETSRTLVEQCGSCYATRRTVETGLWFYGNHLVRGTSTASVDARSAEDLMPLLGPAHEHRWGFSGMTFAFLGMAHGFAHGHPGFNPVAVAVRNDPEVRGRIRRLVDSGEFRSEEVAAILELPAAIPGAGPPLEGDEPSYARGRELLRALGAPEARGWIPHEERGPRAGCPLQRAR